MAPRRSVVRTSTHTMTATAPSATCGTAYRSCTATRGRGSSPSRAIARTVRPTPATRASSAPSAATTAAAEAAHGSHPSGPCAATASWRTGACVDAVAPGPSQDAPDPAGPGQRDPAVDRRHVPPGRGGDGQDDGDEGDHDGDEPPGEGGGAGDPVVVDGGDDHDDGGRERALPGRGDEVDGDGERHGRTAGGLADDEPPAGEETPPAAEALAAVDVGAARRRVLRGKLGRGGGVAEGDDGCDREGGEQPRPGGRGCRREHGEQTRPHHRPDADEDGVTRGETPGEGRAGGVGCHAPQSGGWGWCVLRPA